jgi:hypothetical protein
MPRAPAPSLPKISSNGDKYYDCSSGWEEGRLQNEQMKTDAGSGGNSEIPVDCAVPKLLTLFGA